jgi:hypothetical protein
MTLSISGTSGITLATQFDSASTFAFKNRFINGAMQVAQRGTTGTSGSTVPTTAPTYPSVDRWYAYATGATVSVAQVAGTGAIKNNLQVSGAASVTAVGVGQRIEQLNCYDLAGSTCTLSVNMSNLLLTTVTWTASYATTANTWSAKTTISSGTFTVSGTLANYTTQIVVPAAATTGIEILFTVGAQTSGTWVIGEAQFEKSSTVATSFDYRPYGTELALCQRYYYRVFPAAVSKPITQTGWLQTSVSLVAVTKFPVTMRTAPTALEQSGTANQYAIAHLNTSSVCNAVPAFANAVVDTAITTFTTASVLTAGQGAASYTDGTNGAGAYLGWSAEL